MGRSRKDPPPSGRADNGGIAAVSSISVNDTIVIDDQPNLGEVAHNLPKDLEAADVGQVRRARLIARRREHTGDVHKWQVPCAALEKQRLRHDGAGRLQYSYICIAGACGGWRQKLG